MSNSPFQDCVLFTQRMKEKANKEFSGSIEVEFINRMIADELNELKEAKDDAEIVDAMLDISYYILQHLSTTTIDVETEWKTKYKIALEFDVLKTKFLHVCNTNSFFLAKDREVFQVLINLHLPIIKGSELNSLLTILNVCLTFPYTKGVNIKPVWALIHNANMTKFGPGGRLENGKWMKPSSFVPPDDDIRKEIKTQLQLIEK